MLRPAPVHTTTTVCVDAQVELNGGGEHGDVSVLEADTKAEANEQSPGPGAESGVGAKAEPEAKADEAADFWAALQGKSPEQNGATAVRPFQCVQGALLVRSLSGIAQLLQCWVICS